MALSLCSLRCSNLELESMYRQRQVKEMVPIDRSLGFCKLLISCCLVAAFTLGALPVSHTAMVMWVVYVACLMSHQLVLWCLPKAYFTHRLAFVLVYKFIMTACLMSLVLTHTLEPVQGWGTFAKVLFMGGGVVLMNCTGICMPVLWQYHVPSTLLLLLSFNMLFLPSVVDTVLCTPKSIGYLHQVHAAVESAALQLGSSVLPVSLSSDGVPRTGSKQQAYSLVLWLQLYVGVLVPSMYLYIAEMRSRLNFLQQAPTNQHTVTHVAGQGDTTTPTTAPSPSLAFTSVLQHPLLSCSSSAIALPPNFLVLLHCFALLLGVAVWNVLHLAVGWIVMLGDSSTGGLWIKHVAQQHGAGNCIMIP